MNRNIYSVYDLKAKTYCNPFVMENDDCALREFASAANDPNTAVGRHTFDYCLYRVGSFDYDQGTVTQIQPVSLGIAAGLVITQLEVNSDEN